MTTWQISNLYDQSLQLVEGRGVAKDFEKAFALNAQAARQGHHDAILAMGWFYLNGVGVTRDVERARKWYRNSVRQGEAKAMFSLDQIAFDEGDFANALTWFRRAVDAGHARSLYWIGKLYWRGDGVPRDRKEAMRLFHRAASKKVREAKRVLRFLT